MTLTIHPAPNGNRPTYQQL